MTVSEMKVEVEVSGKWVPQEDAVAEKEVLRRLAERRAWVDAQVEEKLEQLGGSGSEGAIDWVVRSSRRLRDA
jgi:hypothetical protein